MRTSIAKILLFVMFLNGSLANFSWVAFGKSNMTNSKTNQNSREASQATGFEWHKTATLNEKLEIEDRKPNSEEVLLRWDMDNIDGAPSHNAQYTLSYHLAKDKTIKFIVNRNGDKATIEYKVNDDNAVDKSNKSLFIYKDGAYLEANKDNFPDTDNFKLLNVFNGDKKASKVAFQIGRNGGATFRYQNNTIKFVWKDNFMYFLTDGILQGNIYDFDLNYGNPQKKDTKKIFLGINTKTLKVKPFANQDDKNPNGKDEIDQTSRPITEYPGSDNVGVDITFDAPKEWDNGNGYTKVDNKKPVEVVFDLGHIEPEKKLQIKIKNIYHTNGDGNNNVTITSTDPDSQKIKASYSYDTGSKIGKLRLLNLEPSTIYNITDISAQRKKEPFETISATLPVGKIYTYPKFRVIALGLTEYYLEIEPYKGYNGFYVIKQGSQEGTADKWSTYEDKSSGKEKILISVPLNATAPQERYFKVEFSLTSPGIETTELPFTSQTLKYKPYIEDIRLATPKNLQIISSNIIKKDDEPENLFLSLKWDIDKKDVLKNLIKQNEDGGGDPFNIDYSFFKGDTPSKFDKEPFVKLNLKFDKSKEDDLNKFITYEIKYKNLSNPTTISLVEGKSFTTKRIEVLNGKPYDILEANVTFKIPVSSKNDANKLYFQYPNTYFLATKADYVIAAKNNGKPEKHKYNTVLSLPVTLTLNGLANIPIPSPQKLKIIKDSIGKNTFGVEYDTLKYANEGDLLYEYNQVMLKTIDRGLVDESIGYDFYITQRKDLFDKLVALKKGEKIPEDIKIVDYSVTSEMTNEGIDIIFNNIDEQKPVEKDNEQNPTGNLIDTLRQKGVVRLKDIKQNISLDKQKLNFKGLDENETYYVIGLTKLSPISIDTPSLPVLPPFEAYPEKLKEQYSVFSNLVSATTIIKTNPSESEKVPPAPTKFLAENITLNSVELVWNFVKDNLDENVDEQNKKSTLEYEFIRTRGEQLPDSFLKSRDSFEKTWESLSNIKEKAGLKTDKQNLHEFDATKKAFSSQVAKKERFEYLQWNGSDGRIADKTLLPNQIYYYYIRTARKASDGEAYSVWVPVTFTTKNTPGPKNLRVELKEAYDKKTEVVISFDIPKIDIDSIGKDYDLQYSLREDLSDWTKDTTMDKNKLTITENKDGKTLKVKYKITGLKPGKMYTIRVRMLNKILNAPSSYSNEVEHRTSSDASANDYDEQVNNWETNFKDLIEKLKNESYWFAKDTSSNTVVYYRPQYFDKIIASTNNSIIDLAQGKGGSYKEYYLPASAVIKAFEQNKGFKITYKNADIIFNAKTINPNDNDIIKKMSEELKSKKSNIKDYFIKISVDFKENKYNINGSESLSPLASINVSIIGTKREIVELDLDMVLYIEELLTKKQFSKDVKDKIASLVKDKTDNKIMVQETNKLVDSFKAVFGDELSKKLTNESRKTENIQYFKNDIIFAYPIASGISASGYKKSKNSWSSISTKDYSGKKAIFFKETGEYIFAGKKLVIPGINNLPNGDKMTDIVIKYGLDDFLGKNGNINLKAPITREATLGSLARIGGASKTADFIEFFKSKGLTLSNRNMDKNIEAQEAIYVTMKVYEMKTGTKIDTIKIKNYNLTKGIKNINNKYKKSIQVAFDIGIYNNPNMNGKGTISIEEFLKTLYNMSTMVNI